MGVSEMGVQAGSASNTQAVQEEEEEVVEDWVGGGGGGGSAAPAPPPPSTSVPASVPAAADDGWENFDAESVFPMLSIRDLRKVLADDQNKGSSARIADSLSNFGRSAMFGFSSLTTKSACEVVTEHEQQRQQNLVDQEQLKMRQQQHQVQLQQQEQLKEQRKKEQHGQLHQLQQTAQQQQVQLSMDVEKVRRGTYGQAQ
jgi:hypothetical protein